MDELLLDAESVEALREAIGMTELERKYELLLADFRAVVAYMNETHTLVERLAGEEVVSAMVSVSAGAGDRLTINRNISKLPLPSLQNAIKLPKKLPVVAEIVPKVANVNIRVVS